MNCFIKLFFLLSFLLSLVVPGLAAAQAGSSLPVTYETPLAFDASFPVSPESLLAPAHNPPMLPEGLLRLPENERYVLWAELQAGRLTLLERQSNGGLVTRKIIPMSIGINGSGKEREGDKRTPVGVYYLTSFLADSQLLDFYGFGAYPLNYPNAADRLLNRTGSGIWLHGLPKEVAQRPLLDSDGCVVIDNQSLQEMAAFIDTGRTPIILSQASLQWVPKSESQQRRAGLEQAFEAWRQAWESKDNDLYLSFYAETFTDLNQDKEQWASYKRWINNGKSFISVQVSDLGFYTDPGQPDIVNVRYFQTYRSSNYEWDGWKEQLWREVDGRWRIIYEG